MSIYLAWSFYKLAAHLIVLALVAYAAWELSVYVTGTNGKRGPKISKKKVLFGFAVGVTLTLLSAFNVGDRQESLHRSSFDATIPDQRDTMDALKSQRRTIEQVQKEFDDAVIKRNQSVKE